MQERGRNHNGQKLNKQQLPVFINQKLDYLRFSATIAASAIELTFTSNSSERDVKITGAFVPVKIFPLTHLAV